MFERALKLHQAGSLAEAEAAYLAMLSESPEQAAVLANLGVLYLQRSRPDTVDFVKGVECLKKSLKLHQAQPNVHNNLAMALQTAGSFAESDQHYLAAISHAPDCVDLYISRALLLKRVEGIEAAKDWLLQHETQFLDNSAFVLCLGALLLDMGEHEASLNAFEKVIALNPANPTAWYNRGNALRLLRRSEEALTSYRRCLRLDPNLVEALNNMGVLQQELKLFDDALASYDAVLRIRPDAVNATYNRALALENMGRFGEAVDGYTETLKLSPAYPYLMGRIQYAQMQTCGWSGFDDEISKICSAVESGFPASVPFPLLSMTDDLKLQQQCAKTYTDDRFPAVLEISERNRSKNSNRIRIGYFSSDLRTHAVGFLTAGLFEAHDRKDFEFFVFSLASCPQGDVYRERIVRGAEHFIDASGVSDAEVVDLARSFELDIAVDLAGHTMDARTDIFAQRVAPLQVNYLGYPGTMGAPYIDVILADETVIPLGSDDAYSERVYRLPTTFQINDQQRRIGEIRSRTHYGLPTDGLVLASFNTGYKLNPSMFDIWCRLLSVCSDSVLWLLGESEAQTTNLRSEAVSRGISAERLIFADRLPYADHLARYTHVDLVLDTLPFNGGTSTSDALWGGAPVLTCTGQSFASRMSASLLRAVGLPELITTSLDSYEAVAASLVQAPERLKQFKEFLQNNRMALPLFNTAELTRDIEYAYRAMLDD